MKRMTLAFQHGSMRMPSATHIAADYENDVLTLNVSDYTGSIQVYVCDSQGNIIGHTVSFVTSNGVMTLDLGNLAKDCYTISIVLDNATYYGQFEEG